jgi:hypothetical protein
MRRVAAIAAGMVLGLTAPVAAAAAPPPDKIVIDVVTANGSGCPVGTTAVAMSPDNTAMTVTYSQYIARVGAGAGPIEFRRNCQLNLNVHVPHGLTFAILSADYRGFGHLERGAAAMQQANYYFQGQGATQVLQKPFKGPMDNNWQVSHRSDIKDMVYRPCGVQRNLNVNTELRVYAGSSDPKSANFIGMDSTDTAFSTIYHLTWQSSPAK